MRVALVNTMSPFIRGGAEILVDDLAEQLNIFGHEAVLFRIPFPRDYGVGLLNTIVAARMLKLEKYDRVIAFKFPAYCVQHSAKVMWMFHQFRQIYELKGTEYGLADSAENRRMEEIIARTDKLEIPKSKHIYTNAFEVTNRLKKYSGIDSEVLPPPLKDVEAYFCGSMGDYIFYPSRINSMKRQHLAVEAMKYTKTDVKLLVAGQCPESQYVNQIEKIIRDNDLSKKVTVLNEWITDEQKINFMAEALGAIYIPYQEDSCGFVTMEAQYSHKPVITCKDSGGTIEFLENEKTGLFVDPDPRHIAAAMDRLYEDKAKAEKMGEAGYQDIMSKAITWENTIRRLLK